MTSFTVRTFRNGDESAIVELFNKVHNNFSGFVPRSVEYWHWCCLKRPDVKQDGIFLAFIDEKLCGYIVTGLSGNVWEFCVNNDDEEVINVLLGKAEIYLDRAGVPSVNVNLPSNTGIEEILQESGFSQTPAGRMFVTTLSPAGLVQALVAPRKENLMKEFDDEFNFRLCEAPYGVSTNFFVKIHGNAIEVAEGVLSDPSIVVELELVDLLSALFGDMSATRLLFAGKLKIKPFWKFRTVVGLLSTLCLKSQWFFPLSDFI
jgi:hypothetical protein